MPVHTRVRLAAATAAAVVLTTAACGSDTPEQESPSSSSSTSSAAGSDTLVVDGTTVDADWKPACQRSEDGTKGAVDLLELPSLDEIEESGELDGTIVGADFDLDGDAATLTGFRVTNGSQEDLIDGRFEDLTGNKDDMTITYTQEAVRVEGTARGTIDGKDRTDIPFAMDIGCSTWMGLTDEGDVAPRG